MDAETHRDPVSSDGWKLRVKIRILEVPFHDHNLCSSKETSPQLP